MNQLVCELCLAGREFFVFLCLLFITLLLRRTLTRRAIVTFPAHKACGRVLVVIRFRIKFDNSILTSVCTSGCADDST